MLTVDFWLDWTISARVDQLRSILPTLGAQFDLEIKEDVTLVSNSDWAMFDVRTAPTHKPVATIRTQTADESSAHMVMGPGADVSEAGLALLNRAGLVIYTQFILRGLLLPPAPFEPPIPPFD